MTPEVIDMLKRQGLVEDRDQPIMQFDDGGSVGDSGDGGTGAASSATGDSPGAGAAGTGNGTGDGTGDSSGFATSETDPAQTALASLQAELGISPTEAAMMGQSNATGSNVATNGMTMAELSLMAANGLGNADISSNQTVNQALASMAVHSGLNNNIGQIMGAIGGPVVGMVATAANAVAQGHSVSSVVGQIAASIVGTALSNATGVAISANTVNAIASGQIGQAAMGLAIGQVAQATGMSVGTVTAALSGNLGGAVANAVTGAVVGAAAQSMSAGPLGGMALGTMASLSGMPANLASSINQSAIGQTVNSVTSSISSAIASSGIGVPGNASAGISTSAGAAAIADAISAAENPPERKIFGISLGKQTPKSQSQLLIDAVNSGKLPAVAENVPQVSDAPSKSDKYWQNLYSELGMEFSKPPERPANNTASTVNANQATAIALLDAGKEYERLFGSLTPSAAEAIVSSTDPLKYVDSLYTSESEAAEIWKNTTGTNPTEFDLMELIGLGESNATDIAADRGTTTTDEATEFLKGLYGKDYQPSTDELMQLVSKPESTAKTTAQNFYTQDKSTTNKTEAEAFWKAMGNTGPIPEETLFQMLGMPETGAKALSETYKITRDDINATTFDGTKFKDQKEAQAAAIKGGYNTYNWGDNTYYLMSQDQATQLQKDIADGKTAGARPDAFFTLGPGATLSEQLAAAGNPEEYAYKQGDTITVVGKRMAVPEYDDLEAWKAFKDEKQDAGGDNFQSFLTEQFSILQQALKGAPEDSIGKVMADAAMFGYGKMAQLIETFSRTGEAMGIPQAQRGTNIAKQVQSWSNKLVDQGIQNAEAAVLANVAAVTKESIAAERGVKPADISTAELYAQKTAALFKQIPNNPLGVSLFLAGEGIQEIPLLAVSGGVGSVFKNVIGKSVGLSAAVGTNVALNGAESFGGNYGEVKEYLAKRGVPESQIEALAVKSGLEGMAVGMLTSYVGDRALIKSFMGDLATDSFGKVVSTNSAKEWFLGNFEGSLQNMSAQIGKYGSIKSEDEWLNAGIMEGFAQKGIAAGVITAASLDKAVAKDYDGKPVTYKEVIEGTKTFDPKTLDKSFSFGDGVNLGDAIGYHSTFITNPDITPDEYFYTAKAFRDNGLDDFTPQEIASIVGSPGEMALEEIQRLSEPYAETKIAESKTANITPAQVEKIVNDAIKANPSLTAEDVQKIVSDAVKTVPNLTADQVKQIVGTEVSKMPVGATSSDVQKAVDAAKADLTKAVEKVAAGAATGDADLKKAIEALKASGLTPADVQKAVDASAANQSAATKQAITDATKGLATAGGLEAAKAELTKAIEKVAAGAASGNADLQKSIEALKAAGLTPADVQKTVDASAANQSAATKQAIADATKGLATTSALEAATRGLATTGSLEAAKAELAKEIQAARDIGLQGDAALQAGLGSLAAKMGVNQTEVLKQLGTTAADLKTQFASEISGVKTELAQTEKDILAQVAKNEAAGMGRDAALQKAIGDVAVTQKTDAASLLSKLGTTEAALKSQITTQVAGLDAKLSAAIADAKAAGLSGDAALKSAIDKVAADQKTSSASLLGQLGKTEAALKTQFSTELSGVKTQISELEKSLSDEIQAARDIGLQGDAALQAGLNSLSAKMGTNQSALLGQLGKTEAALKTQFASEISGVQAEIAQTEKDILAQVAKNEAAGLSRDAALQKAIGDVAAVQKTDAASLLSKLGTTETALKSQIAGLSTTMASQYNTLSAAQKATADALVAQGKTMQEAVAAAKAETTSQIAGVETRLTDAIAAAEAMGLSRDQAITAAVESVAAELGTTKTNLLSQLGKTEQALRTEFAAGLVGVSAEVKAAYNSLSAEQKALANKLTQQGSDLATAIQTAQQQTQAQITGLGQQVDARINELMQQGQTYQQATQQAIGELNTQNKQLQGLIGTQGRAATQADVDALTQMLGGQRSVDLAYDVTGDKQITQEDIDFLTQVVSGTKTDWRAPVGSAFGPTGLYGQLAANEAQRQADLQAQLQRERDAAAAAAEAQRQGAVKAALGQGQQTLQQIQQQLPQALQQAQQVSTPIYGEMGPYLDIGSELDFGFFKPSPEKLAATKQQQPTKIAAGGYIDDLLAEGMSVDDLLNLLR